jgi:hypothetical protein
MQFPLDYPLTLLLKVKALAPQLSITDANGNLIAYVKQKMFKLKEAVTVFEDEEQTQPIFYLKADRVLDISARYYFTDQQEIPVGSVKRQGMRSLWKARYDIFEDETTTLNIRDENGWVKVMDRLFGQIPLVGILSGYVFRPAYLVSKWDARVVMRMDKQPGFFEGVFKIEKNAEMSEGDEKRSLLSLMMMILLERRRG